MLTERKDPSRQCEWSVIACEELSSLKLRTSVEIATQFEYFEWRSQL